jgi:cobyrinic acid a,c-diamide synthase
MIPRVVIAGTSSGAGKTTVACGLIGALHASGLRVQGFKVGPDYIDPSYHALASGRPGRNLDAFLAGPELVAPLVRHGGAGADVAVIEGVMGLFDGASGRGELASTAHVAKLLDAPVLLVVDAASMARSAAAVVHGYTTFDPDVNVAGIVFNRVGSDHHEQLLREAVEPLGVPVLGALRRDERVVAPERHLGLVPAGEREQRTRAALDTLAGAVAHRLDVAAIERLARAAPAPAPGPAWSAEPPPAPAPGPAWSAESPPAPAPGPAWRPDPAVALGPARSPDPAPAPGPARHPDPAVARAGGARIAIARGPAFSFHYEENLELLVAAGAELAAFDPLLDEALPPDSGALILAGGFPEVFGEGLEANAPLRAEVAAFVAAGKPVLAECGGLLYLCRDLDGHEMCGAIAARASMTRRLTLGYRDAVAATATPWIGAGERVRGHEFHYSHVEPMDGACAAWTLSARGSQRSEGIVAGALQASYLHVHWAAHPEIARRFARVARTAQLGAPGPSHHRAAPIPLRA